MDEIVREPLGGAHADPMGAFPYIKDAVMNIWHTKCAPGRPRCGGRALRPPACPGSARSVGAWRRSVCACRGGGWSPVPGPEERKVAARL